MNALVFLLIPATIGVDFGWERQPDNSIEYILQIEPEALDSMKTGTELISSLPPQLRNIRDYRIRVGRDPLPNQNKIPPEFGNAGASTAQPNIASNNYGPTNAYSQPNNYTQPNNYATTNNYPQSTPGAFPSGTYPTNTYPPTSNSFANNSFANNSTAPNYNPYAGTTASNNNGMSPVGTPTVPTSTSGFPLQTSNATYPTNNSGQTLANLPPPPGTYPNSNYPNPYPAGSATPTGYNPQGYNPNGYTGTNPYGTNPYATNNYAPAGYQPPAYQNPAYQNQPYQQAPNPYAYPQQQYLAMNGGPVPAGYGAAKPSLNDPAANPSGNFPQGTQFTQPGMNNAGLPPLNPNFNTTAAPGTNPATLPANGNANGNPPLNSSFVNTGAQNIDPHTGAVLPNGQTTTKEPQSQWASLGFALVALFASIGANVYIGWQNHYLRERCRMLVADRAAY